VAPGSDRERVTLADYRDRWLVIVFYPRDFSLVCPTELTALSTRMDEFRSRGCDILGISTDSIATHQRWIAAPSNQGGLDGLEFPLASDEDGSVSRAYGVYLEPQHIALRGLFIVDPNGVLQYQTVHNLSVGRRSDEVLRVLAALESGGMCPEDWCVKCATLDATQALMPGSMVSHYRIEVMVGHGTFGSVFRAFDTILERTVALKVFKPDSAPLAALAEARSAAALNHPNVCTIFAVDDSEGMPLIVMEYLDGKPLSTILLDGPVPKERVARIGRQIAEGLAAAHRMGIVHGDLKPANIMLVGNDAVKITDFGLARRFHSHLDEEKTQTWSLAEDGSISGTPAYMSPEQSRGETVTPASDVFSLAVVLYEMCAGRKAFTGDNVLQVLSQIRRVDPEAMAVEVGEPMASVLRRALLHDPAQRHVTMDQISKILA
jgi:alkyl hydroperoxide reductase subunit AhpC/predicted Ser/Thr protein kinase